MRTNPSLLVALCLGAGLTAQAAPSRFDPAPAAREIDRLVEEGLSARQQKANPIVDDATFVRRAYLGIVGRIPSGAEADAFLREGGSNKRNALIDRLLASPGHVSHAFNWWADLLRVRTRLNRQVSGEPYAHWIKDAIEQNKPYDVMVREMLAAEGAAYARGNGATGYHLRDLAMPEDDVSNTMRLFLGTRLECAQCHNHPFDKWKQKEFYELVAFNGGMQYRSNFDQSNASSALREIGREMVQKHGQQAQQAMRQMTLAATLGLQGSGTGLTRLPQDYQYKDAKAGQPVAARAPFGPSVDLAIPTPVVGQRQPRQPRARGNAPVGKPIESRAAFGKWLTGPDNPRFATVIVNRVWKRTFGRALIEPLDDLRDDTVASNPELQAYLEELIVDLGYDLREFERVILRTRLFQREVTPGDPGDDFAFAGPLLRRMSGEQVWDSLLTLVVPDVDSTLRPAGAKAEEVYASYERLTTSTAEQLRGMVETALLRYTDPAKFREMQRQRAAEQMSMAQMAQAPANDDKQKQARPLMRELARARQRKDEAAVARITAQLQKLGVPLPGEQRPRQRPDQNLARASDLSSPAPAGHLLREFGQSERETIDAGHTAASVPQVLALLNGFVEQRILDNRGAELRRAIDAQKDPAGRIEAVYLGILGRKPTSSEASSWRAALTADGDAALRDLVWVLLNSHEFRFIR